MTYPANYLDSYVILGSHDDHYSLTNKDANAEIVVFMPWNQTLPFAVSQVGGLISNAGVLQFQLPATHPYIANLWCNSVAVEVIHDVNIYEGPDWLTAKVTVKYGLLQFPSAGDQKLEIDYEVTSQELVVDKGQFTANDQPLLDSDIQPIKILNDAKLTIKAPFRPTLDPSLWNQYSGNVNSSPFPGWIPNGWTEGKVMFSNPSTKRTFAFANGTDTWEFTFTFLIKADSDPGANWNSIWRASADDGGQWLQLDQTMYPENELNNIFIPAYGE